MNHTTTRPQWVARAATIALWGVGSAYLTINDKTGDPVVYYSAPVVWAVVISLPILATYARYDRQWVASALLWVAALAGCAYTLQMTIGRQAESRDVRVSQAGEMDNARHRITLDLDAAKGMLNQARAKCASGRTCYDSTRATISVYEGAVAGHEARLAKLTVAAPDAGEKRIARLIQLLSGANVSELVELITPIMFGLVLELATFAAAMFGWHPSRKSLPVQFSRTVKLTSTQPPKGRRTFRKDDAMADIVQFSRPVMQETLAGRWNVTKAMVSMWLAEWEEMGIVDRRRIGKHKTVQSKKLVDFAVAA